MDEKSNNKKAQMSHAYKFLFARNGFDFRFTLRSRGKQKGLRLITEAFPSSANSTALECGLVTEKIIHGRIETGGGERLRQRSATIEEVAENPQRIRDINVSIIIGIS